MWWSCHKTRQDLFLAPPSFDLLKVTGENKGSQWKNNRYFLTAWNTSLPPHFTVLLFSVFLRLSLCILAGCHHDSSLKSNRVKVFGGW